jgi:hypothetical protein
MSFRIWTIFYVFALFAAAMATFGSPAGIAASCFVLMFWALMRSSLIPLTFKGWLWLIGIVTPLVLLLLPAMQSVRESSRIGVCRNNIKMLALAVLDYASSNGKLPPAIVVDERGLSLKGWRTLILRELERADVSDVVDRAGMRRAPTNLAVTFTDVEVFECPSGSISTLPNYCDYFAIVGARTAWPEHRARRLSDLTDPKSHTILIMEVHGRDTVWSKPSDLSFEEAVDLLTGATQMQYLHEYRHTGGFWSGILGKRGHGIHVAMADGSVHFLVPPLPKELAVALLTVDGNEGDVHDQLADYTRPQVDHGKCYGLGVFIVLSLLPAASHWRRQITCKRVKQRSLPHDGFCTTVTVLTRD